MPLRARTGSIYGDILRRRSLAMPGRSSLFQKPFEEIKREPLVQDEFNPVTGLPIGREKIVNCQPWRVPIPKQTQKRTTRLVKFT